MSRWFRHYAGMMRDEKLVAVAIRSKQPVERVMWVWGAILESAAEINDGGRYEVDTGEASYFLRCDADEIGRILSELERAGRLDQGVVARWGDRQFSSDAGAERQRRYRERRNAKSDDQGLQADRNGDGAVTSRDGAVTPQETETETETYTVASATDAVASPDWRDQLWRAGLYCLIRQTGKTEQAARQLIGKWSKAAGDDCRRVLLTIEQAETERIGDPVAWITAALKPPDKPPKKLTQGESLRNMAREKGIIDATGTPIRRLETSERDRENPGAGDAIRLAIAGDHSW